MWFVCRVTVIVKLYHKETILRYASGNEHAYKVQSIVKHPGYERLVRNDIALLRLERKISFESRKQTRRII